MARREISVTAPRNSTCYCCCFRGCRRTVPGQYLAVDPKGRSCMVSAVERQKFVYILNRDLQSRLTISSPLEAHKSYTIVFATVGLDVGFDNPQFAAIECQ